MGYILFDSRQPAAPRGRRQRFFVHGGDATGWPAQARSVLWRCRRSARSWPKERDAAIRPKTATAGWVSTQEWKLKIELEQGWRTPVSWKGTLQMFHALPHRISLGAGRWRLLPAEQSPQPVQTTPQLAPQLVRRLQRKGQSGLFCRRFGRESRQPLYQPLPQQVRGQRVTRQHVRQENGKGLPATAAPSTIGTKHPLSAHMFFGAIKRVVAVENAVSVQSLALLAVRARQLLERKNCAWSSEESRTKRKNGCDIRSCCLSQTGFVQHFSDGTPDGATHLNGIMERERTALTAFQPVWDRNLG